MVQVESLKKNSDFKKVLKEKKFHSDFFSVFAAKKFIKLKNKNALSISFVMKKKNWKCYKKKQNKTKTKSYCI